MSDLIYKVRLLIEEVGDCLEWQGTMGTGKRNRSQPIVHRWNPEKGYHDKLPVRRLLWEDKHGPIPAGRIVYCTCGNDRCIGHLRLGVRGDAHRTRARLGLMKHSPAARAALTRGARNRSTAKHSIEQVRAVRELIAHDVPTILISWATDVSASMISDIRTGRSWKEAMAVGSVFDWRP